MCLSITHVAEMMSLLTSLIFVLVHIAPTSSITLIKHADVNLLRPTGNTVGGVDNNRVPGEIDLVQVESANGAQDSWFAETTASLLAPTAWPRRHIVTTSTTTTKATPANGVHAGQQTDLRRLVEGINAASGFDGINYGTGRALIPLIYADETGTGKTHELNDPTSRDQTLTTSRYDDSPSYVGSPSMTSMSRDHQVLLVSSTRSTEFKSPEVKSVKTKEVTWSSSSTKPKRARKHEHSSNYKVGISDGDGNSTVVTKSSNYPSALAEMSRDYSEKKKPVKRGNALAGEDVAVSSSVDVDERSSTDRDIESRQGDNEYYENYQYQLGDQDDNDANPDDFGDGVEVVIEGKLPTKKNVKKLKQRPIEPVGKLRENKHRSRVAKRRRLLGPQPKRPTKNENRKKKVRLSRPQPVLPSVRSPTIEEFNSFLLASQPHQTPPTPHQQPVLFPHQQQQQQPQQQHIQFGQQQQLQQQQQQQQSGFVTSDGSSVVPIPSGFNFGAILIPRTHQHTGIQFIDSSGRLFNELGVPINGGATFTFPVTRFQRQGTTEHQHQQPFGQTSQYRPVDAGSFHNGNAYQELRSSPPLAEHEPSQFTRDARFSNQQFAVPDNVEVIADHQHPPTFYVGPSTTTDGGQVEEDVSEGNDDGVTESGIGNGNNKPRDRDSVPRPTDDTVEEETRRLESLQSSGSSKQTTRKSTANGVADDSATTTNDDDAVGEETTSGGVYDWSRVKTGFEDDSGDDNDDKNDDEDHEERVTVGKGQANTTPYSIASRVEPASDEQPITLSNRKKITAVRRAGNPGTDTVSTVVETGSDKQATTKATGSLRDQSAIVATGVNKNVGVQVAPRDQSNTPTSGAVVASVNGQVNRKPEVETVNSARTTIPTMISLYR